MLEQGDRAILERVQGRAHEALIQRNVSAREWTREQGRSFAHQVAFAVPGGNRFRKEAVAALMAAFLLMRQKVTCPPLATTRAFVDGLFDVLHEVCPVSYTLNPQISSVIEDWIGWDSRFRAWWDDIAAHDPLQFAPVPPPASPVPSAPPKRMYTPDQVACAAMVYLVRQAEPHNGLDLCLSQMLRGVSDALGGPIDAGEQIWAALACAEILSQNKMVWQKTTQAIPWARTAFAFVQEQTGTTKKLDPHACAVIARWILSSDGYAAWWNAVVCRRLGRIGSRVYPFYPPDPLLQVVSYAPPQLVASDESDLLCLERFVEDDGRSGVANGSSSNASTTLTTEETVQILTSLG